MTFDENEYSKFVVFTDKCSFRILDTNRLNKTQRLGKKTEIVPCFKSDVHNVVAALKLDTKLQSNIYQLYLSNQSMFELSINDYHLTEASKNARKNIDIPRNILINNAYPNTLERIDDKTPSHPIIVKEKEIETPIVQDHIEETISLIPEDNEPVEQKEEKEDSFEQISIFDDLEEN